MSGATQPEVEAGPAPSPGRGAVAALGIPLLDPGDGSPLFRDSPHSLIGGGVRWPVVDGIPYLRIGREAIRRAALDALDAGDARAALVSLLSDQDDYARTPPPGPSDLGRLVDRVGPLSLRESMDALAFGPVADYFAHRWSTPTFLSGLALLDEFRLDGAVVVEVACGIGHYLRELSMRGLPCLGLDVVFAKLWLARRFLVDESVPLVCGDASAGWPLGAGRTPATIFCHDAFYFLPEKPRVVGNFRSTAGDGGRVLIGHAHNANFDHRGVSGEPRSTGEYATLLRGCLLFDDAELARSAWSGRPASAKDAAELNDVEAVAMAWGPSGRIARPGSLEGSDFRLTVPIAGRELRLNPILADRAGRLVPDWPSHRFEAEYAAESPYLLGEPTPMLGPPLVFGGDEAEVDRLARRRILLDLPERW